MPRTEIELPKSLQSLIRQFARAWAESDLRVHPDADTILHWQNLISNWAHTPDLPLFIRKGRSDRGQAKTHSSGRILVPVDNSTAQWAYTLALAGKKPSLSDIRTLVENDQIPIGMILTREERSSSQYSCPLTLEFNLNQKGWKLAHIQDVGLNQRTPITEIPLQTLREHFYKFLSPKNMFVIPKQHAGIAEDPIMVKEMRKYQKKMLKADPSEL